MARAIWKGILSFGLIDIPARLYPAALEQGPRFRLLHQTDSSTVRSEYVCEADGRPVPREELVRGYEYEPGKFVVLSKPDFDSAAVEKSRKVEILDFINAGELDERYFVTPYYLAPYRTGRSSGAGGERAYALLREALREMNKVGIARLALREQQHLCAISAVGDVLLLTMLRFADELAPEPEVQAPAREKLSPQEMELAKALVSSLSAPFTPQKYEDQQRQNLERIIQAKINKRQEPALSTTEAAPWGADVINLMERLRKSLEAEKKPASKPSRPGAAVA